MNYTTVISNANYLRMQSSLIFTMQKWLFIFGYIFNYAMLARKWWEPNNHSKSPGELSSPLPRKLLDSRHFSGFEQNNSNIYEWILIKLTGNVDNGPLWPVMTQRPLAKKGQPGLITNPPTVLLLLIYAYMYIYIHIYTYMYIWRFKHDLLHFSRGTGYDLN